jgi:hypothetical protein
MATVPPYWEMSGQPPLVATGPHKASERQPAMTNIERSPEDITIRDAMRLAGVSDQLLRRALQRGELPRRYVQTARGLQLVFQRAALQRWIAGRRAPRRRRAVVRVMPTPAVSPVTLLDALRQLGRALTEALAAMADLSVQLAQQQDQLTDLCKAIAGLAAPLSVLEPDSVPGSSDAFRADHLC